MTNTNKFSREMNPFDAEGRSRAVEGYNNYRITKRCNKAEAVARVAADMGYTHKNVRALLNYAEHTGEYLRSNKVTDNEAKEIVDAYSKLGDIGSVANWFGRSKSTVSKYVNKYLEDRDANHGSYLDRNFKAVPKWYADRRCVGADIAKNPKDKDDAGNTPVNPDENVVTPFLEDESLNAAEKPAEVPAGSAPANADASARAYTPAPMPAAGGPVASIPESAVPATPASAETGTTRMGPVKNRSLLGKIGRGLLYTAAAVGIAYGSASYAVRNAPAPVAVTPAQVVVQDGRYDGLAGTVADVQKDLNGQSEKVKGLEGKVEALGKEVGENTKATTQNTNAINEQGNYLQNNVMPILSDLKAGYESFAKSAKESADRAANEAAERAQKERNEKALESAKKGVKSAFDRVYSGIRDFFAGAYAARNAQPVAQPEVKPGIEPTPEPQPEGLKVTGDVDSVIGVVTGDSTGVDGRVVGKVNVGTFGAKADMVYRSTDTTLESGEDLSKTTHGEKLVAGVNDLYITLNHASESENLNGNSTNTETHNEAVTFIQTDREDWKGNKDRAINGGRVDAKNGDLSAFVGYYSDVTRSDDTRTILTHVTFPNDPIPDMDLETNVKGKSKSDKRTIIGGASYDFGLLQPGILLRQNTNYFNVETAVDGVKVASEKDQFTDNTFGLGLGVANDWLNGRLLALYNSGSELTDEQKFEAAASLVAKYNKFGFGAGFERKDGENKTRGLLYFGDENASGLERVLMTAENNDLLPEGTIDIQKFWAEYSQLGEIASKSLVLFGEKGEGDAYKVAVGMPLLFVPNTSITGWAEKTEAGSEIIRVEPRIEIPGSGLHVSGFWQGEKDEREGTSNVVGFGLGGKF